MKRQTFTDFEFILVDGKWREREKEVKEYINDPRLKYIRQNDVAEGYCTGLAHADNQGFRACEGELIVCLQDYIWINPDGLANYWAAYQANPSIIVSGVGNQYAKPCKEDIVDPNGKITVFKEPYTRRPEQESWRDPRINDKYGSFYRAGPSNWELNWASIPRKIIYELGGMDEEYDKYGFAWDNVNIAVRAEALGYYTYLDQTNICMGFDHDGWWPNPLKVEKKSPMEYHFSQMEKMAKGEIPIKYNYL